MSYKYHQLLKYVYLEGYADSYESAECLLESLNDDEFEYLCEGVFSSKFSGAVTADADERAAETHKTVADAEHTSPKNRKRYRDTASQHLVSARRKRRKTNEEFYGIIDYLVTEGYTDNYDSAISIYESMSDEWLDTILEVKGGGRVSFRGNTDDRGMPLNPSMKLYRKKIKLETGMEDEENRIRGRHNAGDGQYDDYTQSDNWRPERVSRGERGRRASAKREIENSPKIKKLQSRWDRLSDAEREN